MSDFHWLINDIHLWIKDFHSLRNESRSLINNIHWLINDFHWLASDLYLSTKQVGWFFIASRYIFIPLGWLFMLWTCRNMGFTEGGIHFWKVFMFGKLLGSSVNLL